MTQKQPIVATRETDESNIVQTSALAGDVEEQIHLPGPSILPVALAGSLLIVAFGLLIHWSIAVVGALLSMAMTVAWARPGSGLATPAHAPDHAAETHIESRSLAWWGMVLFITTEAILFGYLISGYLYLRVVTAPVWPPEGVERLEILLPSIATILLLSSSFPIHWASSGIRQGNLRRLQLGLALTVLIGAIFLGLQAYEYFTVGFTPQSHIYGSVFFTLTGFHGAHVLGGLLILSVTLWHALRGRYSAERHFGVEAAEMYWHFVDGVWILLFTVLYLV